MKWKSALCAALAVGAAAADVEYSNMMMRGLNLAVAGPAATQPAQGSGGQPARSGSGSGNAPAPAPADNKDKNAHADARPHEAPRHDAKAPAPSATAKSAAGGGGGRSAGDQGGRKQPTKTHKGRADDDDDDDYDDDDDDEEEQDEEAEKRYMARIKADRAAGRQPGRMKMVVPPRTVHTPLFELDSVVELQWEYDKNVVEVPEKLMISVQLPKDPHAEGGAKPVLYDIAVNITGKQRRFFWDTKNDIPEGIGMREGSGYTMYFYDGEIGFRMSDVVPAGYLIKYAMPFAFYSSRYANTNDGVPRNYNPNAAARPAPGRLLLAALLLPSLLVAARG